MERFIGQLEKCCSQSAGHFVVAKQATQNSRVAINYRQNVSKPKTLSWWEWDISTCVYLIFFVQFYVTISGIIHTVGPRGIKPQKLQSCYKTSLDLLTKNNLRTIVSLLSIISINMATTIINILCHCILQFYIFISSLAKAFPCISTGIYGYPSHEAAPVAIKTVRTFLESNFDKVM